MEISDFIPNNGEHRDLYCDDCGTNMDLTFPDFSATVTGVQIDIRGLPYLYCQLCNKNYLTDRSRMAIVELHRQASEKGATKVDITRKKKEANFGFSDIPFLIDADDYYYIPGLYREFHIGFLTPLFFNRAVLIKFDNSPDYRVRFASQSYGEIDTADDCISFGINRHGKVIMWLGDVAKLPQSEQFYLRSENIPSDHSIGSEFYDGQIECKFTEPPKEALIIKSRSSFSQSFEERFKAKPFHLDGELIETIANLTPPLVDTEKERKHIFDSLNRIFVEAIDNAGLERLLKDIGASSTGTGSLKRMQAVLETVDNTGTVGRALMPFFVLYDLRIAYSHLTSASKRGELVSSSERRLGVKADAVLAELYQALLDALVVSLTTLTSLLSL